MNACRTERGLSSDHALARGRTIVASVLVALAVSMPALAQGKSQSHKKNGSGPTPPSRNDLAAPPPVSSAGGGAPLAWLDDASVLDPGGVSVGISAMHWTGSGLGEVNAPIVDAALGLTRRVQLSASVPHVVGSADPTGPAGGIGTSYFTTKIGLLDAASGFKIAASPTLEVLGPGVVDALAPGQHRVQMGFPLSAEFGRGPARVYGGAGYFTRGAWFTGVGGSYAVNQRVSAFSSFSRAWRRADVPDVPIGDRDRNEISGGASYALTTAVRVFGSIGRTVATLDENGAGTTIAGGLSFLFTSGTVGQAGQVGQVGAAR
jgi:hypothetical protein